MVLVPAVSLTDSNSLSPFLFRSFNSHGSHLNHCCDFSVSAPLTMVACAASYCCFEVSSTNMFMFCARAVA